MLTCQVACSADVSDPSDPEIAIKSLTDLIRQNPQYRCVSWTGWSNTFQ